jgi:hypothetical protein
MKGRHTQLCEKVRILDCYRQPVETVLTKNTL